MKLKLITIAVLVLNLYPEYNNISAQYLPDNNGCYINSGTGPGSGAMVQMRNTLGTKPNRTDISGNNPAPDDAYFPVLVIFVQFKNEVSDPRNTWQMNSAPVYLNKMISKQKKNNGNWWEFYDSETEILSSHWIEISRGKFHVISPVPEELPSAFSVVLPYEANYYASLGSIQGDLKINEHIWQSLTAQGLTDWKAFDRWKYDADDGNFYFTPEGQGDGYIDMIYKIHKSRGNGGMINYAGFAKLSCFNDSFEYLIDTVNNLKINYGVDFKNSGITVSFRCQLPQYIATIGHEHGHLMFCSNGHHTYSRVSFGFGFDYFYSPGDMILNGYMSSYDAILNSENILGDFSSRNNKEGNLLKVPIRNNECFLLASRNKVSKWDRVMTGDVAQLDPYGDTSEYGNGLYIYHLPGNLRIPETDISQQDLECADGLYEWEYAGQSEQQVAYDCFISNPLSWYYYRKKKVLYDNDPSELFRTNYQTNKAEGDGISFRFLNLQTNSYHCKWWGEGEKPSNPCEIGKDRLQNTKEEIYTRFDIGGDRYDPWYPGYNEIFSPYSSPNTNNWSNQKSGIFIRYRSFNEMTKEASIEVYKTGENGISEEEILKLTPPSRPMGLTAPSENSDNQKNKNIVTLKWNHNMEPDMNVFSEKFKCSLKKYNIYKMILHPGKNNIPDVLKNSEKFYDKIASLEICADSIPEFRDSLTEIIQKDSENNSVINFTVRYRIQAVDKYNDESVLSDFVNVNKNSFNYLSDGRINGKRNEQIGLIKENNYYMQNYPNPFNPATTITFQLPVSGHVTLKVYDITGKEISALLNEFMENGKHNVTFEGSGLPSGVYFYKLVSDKYSELKKMMLIK